MPSARAASSALPRSREAIAVTSLHAPFCIPGMTFFTPILAVLRIPQRTLLDIGRHHSRKVAAGKIVRSRPALLLPGKSARHELSRNRGRNSQTTNMSRMALVSLQVLFQNLDGLGG